MDADVSRRMLVIEEDVNVAKFVFDDESPDVTSGTAKMQQMLECHQLEASERSDLAILDRAKRPILSQAIHVAQPKLVAQPKRLPLDS
jgi:hypothetical protein